MLLDCAVILYAPTADSVPYNDGCVKYY